MNSEKAQLSWLRTLFRNEAPMSLSELSSAAMCLCSSNDGQGSGPIRGEEQSSSQQSQQKMTKMKMKKKHHQLGLRGEQEGEVFTASN